jgi:hypothetical protein
MSPALSLSERGYTNPELLVETDWLERHLEDPMSVSLTRGRRINTPPAIFLAR